MSQSIDEIEKEMREISNELRNNQRNMQALLLIGAGRPLTPSFSGSMASSSSQVLSHHSVRSGRLSFHKAHQNDHEELFITALKRRPIDMDLITTLIQVHKVNPNTSTMFGDNLLHVLIEADQIKDLKKALSLGVNPNNKGGMDKTPLSQLINKSWSYLNLDAAKILIEAGANPDTTNRFNANLLHTAIESRSIANVEKALALGVNPENSDGFRTPMQLATRTFSSRDAQVVCGLISSAIERRKKAFTSPMFSTSKIMASTMAPPRSPTTSSVAPYLTQPKIIRIEQPFDLNSLLNRPNSGQLICEYILEKNPDFDSLTFLGKSDSAKEQVFNYICGLEFDKKFKLVELGQDRATGLGFFFNVYRFKWGIGTSFRVQLEELYQSLVNEKNKAALDSATAPMIYADIPTIELTQPLTPLPNSHLGFYPVLQSIEPNPVASAPPQPEPLLATDPLTWDAKKVAMDELTANLTVPGSSTVEAVAQPVCNARPEDELADEVVVEEETNAGPRI